MIDFLWHAFTYFRGEKGREVVKCIKTFVGWQARLDIYWDTTSKDGAVNIEVLLTLGRCSLKIERLMQFGQIGRSMLVSRTRDTYAVGVPL